MKKLTLRIVLSMGVAAALLTLLMVGGGVSPGDALETLARLPPEIYALALGLHVVTYCLRTLRFMVLIPRAARPAFPRALAIASAHNMASYVLPAKTGEASLVVYLRVHAGVAPSVGLASLLVARFLDGAAMCAGLATTCFWLYGSGRHPGLEWLAPIAALLTGMTLVFVILSMRGHLVLHLIEAILRWLRLHHWSLGERMLVRLNGLALALRGAGEAGRLYLAALATVPLWFSVFGFYTVLARAMGLPEWITFPETAFGASFASLCNLLPVNGGAGIGTQELGWVTGFNKFLGVDYDVALATGIGVHLVQLFNIVVMGLLGHLALGLIPHRRQASSD